MRNIFGAKATASSGDPVACLCLRAASCAPEKWQRGEMVIGKINVILIGLIVVILIGLISKDEINSPLTPHVMRIQSQVEVPPPAESTPAADDAQNPSFYHPSQEQAAPVAPLKTELKGSGKRAKKAAIPSDPPIHLSQTSNASGGRIEPPANHDVAAEEVATPKEPAKKILVFNIWSVSELRLRTAYASYLNDSAIPAAQLEARKKEYLNFVSHRTKKCGELDNKFASNINTVEKLTINKGEVEVLECHANENNAELDKLDT